MTKKSVSSRNMLICGPWLHHQYKGFLDRNGINSRADINVFGKSLAELIRRQCRKYVAGINV